MTTLSSILDNGMCTGCGACTAAIRRSDFAMSLTVDGYLRPERVDLSPSQTRTLGKVCPGAAIDGRSSEVGYHPLWGRVLEVATGYATDPEVRFRGSSGGVLSALAIGLLESGEVDFVVVNEADKTDAINNSTVASTTRVELLSAAGSRYAPSSPLAGLNGYLELGKRFAFIGKPCDIAGLERMSRRDSRIDKLIPYRLAFFCAGIPSRRGTLAVLEKLGVRHSDCARFQYRGDGWPGLARATRHDGSEASMDYGSSWGQILNRHLQFRCKICPDGIGEAADIVCADAWYGKSGYPDFSERDGRSLIIARTAAGVALLERSRVANWVVSEPLELNEVQHMQPYQAYRKRNVIARILALKVAGRQTPRFRSLGLLQLAFRTPITETVRNAYGTFRRAYRRGRL